MAETVRSRFAKTIRDQRSDDRYPLIEWATWWNRTLDRWRAEGLPHGLDHAEIKRHFGLDVGCQHWFAVFAPSAPKPEDGQSWVRDEADYDDLKPH